jgi:ketosteroid isomerase-like protein
MEKTLFLWGRRPAGLVLLLVFLATGMLLAAPQRRPQRRPPPPPSDADRQAIENLHQREIQATMAYDINGLAELWDEDIVSLPPGMPPLIGLSANIDFLKQSQKAMANVEILGYTQDWREVRQVGEYAFEWGIIRSRMRSAADQKEVEQDFKVMRVLKRQPAGTWKVYRTIWNDLPAEKPKG